MCVSRVVHHVSVLSLLLFTDTRYYCKNWRTTNTFVSSMRTLLDHKNIHWDLKKCDYVTDPLGRPLNVIFLSECRNKENQSIIIIHFPFFSVLGNSIPWRAGLCVSVGVKSQTGLHSRYSQLSPWPQRQETNGQDQDTRSCQPVPGRQSEGLFPFHIFWFGNHCIVTVLVLTSCYHQRLTSN